MIIRSLIAAALATSAFPLVLTAEEPNEKFDRLLKENFEPAVLLDDSTSPDGKLSVIYVARKKNLKPADWPSILSGVNVNGTEAGGNEDYREENWVVSLPEKKRLGVVTSDSDNWMAYYDRLNHRDFSALWAPEQEGWHYGLLNFGARWGCADIFLVNSDGEAAKVTSVRKVLDAAAQRFMSARVKISELDRYVVGYQLLGVTEPGSSVGDSTTVKVGFIAEIPKEEADSVEGTLTVKLARNNKGVASATVLGVKAGLEQPAGKPAPAPKPEAFDFAAFRQEWNEKSKTWKAVTKNLPKPDADRTAVVQGWVESNVIQRLVHVDSTDDKNRTITLYYWREGQLTSVFELRTGDHVEISCVGEATNTYNFVNEKLVAWSSTGERDSEGSGNDQGMQEIGEEVLKKSIKLAQPIYKAIGAD